MPVVLPNDDAAALWIDPEADETSLSKLLGPTSEEATIAWPFSRAVKKPENDRPDLVEPLNA